MKIMLYAGFKTNGTETVNQSRAQIIVHIRNFDLISVPKYICVALVRKLTKMMGTLSHSDISLCGVIKMG